MSFFDVSRSLLEALKPGSLRLVSVDEHGFSAFNVLEKAHCCILYVFSKNVLQSQLFCYVKLRVYKNTAVAPLALVRLVVLANRSQVLPVQTWLLLQLVLAMRKPAAGRFWLVLARYTFKPKSTELCADFLLPRVELFALQGVGSETPAAYRTQVSI